MLTVCRVGETVLIGAGALKEDAVVAVRRLNLGDLEAETGVAAPASGVLQAVGAFRLDLGSASSLRSVQVSIPQQSAMAATLTRTGIEFMRQNKVVGQVNLVDSLGQDNNFDGAYLTGSKTQPVVFTDDLSRAYWGDAAYTDKSGNYRPVDKNSWPRSNEVLSALGLHATNAKGYNTQFGVVLSKRTPLEIAKIPQHLLSEESPTESAIQATVEKLQTDFDLDTKGLDMVFFATPDMPPQAVAQEQVVVVSAPSAAVSTVRKMTYGVCELFYATEDDKGDIHDSSVNSLNATGYMTDFLSPAMQNLLKSKGSGGIDWIWFAEWSNSFTVKLLQGPAHGKFVNTKHDPYDQYLPDRDYVGKDRVDLLVEGKDDRGRPIALTLKYFINVLPEKEIHRIVDKRITSQTQKKLCGVGKDYWRISQNGLVPSDPSEQDTDALSALFATASQPLTIANLSGASLGQVTGTGPDARITLDDNAAGYGWFVDATPADSSEYLPTSNPNVWLAKEGSAAAGRMDMLSVFLHEYGHALGLNHSVDGQDFMASTLQPGEGVFWRAMGNHHSGKFADQSNFIGVSAGHGRKSFYLHVV